MAYPNRDLVERSISALKTWGDQVPQQTRVHVWSLLPVKYHGALPGTTISYVEADDKAFFEKFLRLREGEQLGSRPYFDPFSAVWLTHSYWHSNAATFRKGTFANSWRACTWTGDDLTLANSYAEIFVEKVLTKAGRILRIPAAAAATWFLRTEEQLQPADAAHMQSEADLIACFRKTFNFRSDEEWRSIFDASTSLGDFTNYSTEASLSRDDVLAIAEPYARESAGVPVRRDASAVGRRIGARIMVPEEVEASSEGEELILPQGLIQRIVAALEHSHVRLIGAPGTGKSTLARAVMESVVGDDFAFALASSDWTTAEVIGGQMPDPENPQTLIFEPGFILSSAEANRWVCVDEINRADIDSAFGALFSLLAGFDTELPYRTKQGKRIKIYARRPEGALDEGEYGLPDTWRMVATMNSWDKLSLNRMSFAFSRRWCSIYVPVPGPEDYARILETFKGELTPGLSPNVFAALKLTFAGQGGDPATFRDLDKALGPGIAKSVVRDMAAMLRAGVTESDALAEAIASWVLPQFEGALDLSEPLELAVRAILKMAGASNATSGAVLDQLSIYTGKEQ